MKKRAFGLLVSIALVSSGAFAARPQVYVDVGVGHADQQAMPAEDEFSTISDTSGTLSSSNQDLGGRVAVGLGWGTGKYTSVGMELGAAVYGANKYSQGNTSLNLNYYGIELLGVGKLHLSKVLLIGKAGLTNERVHPEKDNLDNDNIESDSTILPEVGAGLGFNISKHAQLSTIYYHTFGQDVSFNTASDATALPSINLVFLELSFNY